MANLSAKLKSFLASTWGRFGVELAEAVESGGGVASPLADDLDVGDKQIVSNGTANLTLQAGADGGSGDIHLLAGGSGGISIDSPLVADVDAGQHNLTNVAAISGPTSGPNASTISVSNCDLKDIGNIGSTGNINGATLAITGQLADGTYPCGDGSITSANGVIAAIS